MLLSHLHQEEIGICVAKTTNVNFIMAKRMLEEKEVCILKAKASEIKSTIAELKKFYIYFSVISLLMH